MAVMAIFAQANLQAFAAASRSSFAASELARAEAHSLVDAVPGLHLCP